MALICETGQVYESCGEVNVEWKIPDFFSLSGVVDSYFQSPAFFLCDSYWRLRLYPKGTKDTPQWVGLFLLREDSGPPKSVTVSVDMERSDQESRQHGYKTDTVKYTETESKKGWDKFILISDLENQKSQLAPSGVLTLICTLKREFPCPTEVSLSARLWNLSRDLKTMLIEGKETDFTLKAKGGCELRAHRKILDARSGYFAGMFANDFQENTSGVADIDDIEKGVFQCISKYLYTGEAEGMADRNVCKIYVAADKLVLEELKKLCVHYMKENLSGDLVCDVIEIAEKYDEAELKETVLDHIADHAMEIFDSEQWKKFSAENSLVVAKILEKIIVRRKT